MASFHLVALFISFLSVVHGQYTCPTGFTKFQQSCFAYVDHEQAWPEAQSTCASMGAYIVEIFDQATNDFIVEMAQQHSHKVIWLGGSDLVSPGQWFWARSGIPVDKFDDWAPNQPDGNKGDSADTEDCMELNIDKYGGHWNDDECEHRQRFICQRPVDEEIIG